MSKRDIKAELNNNSIIGGFIAPSQEDNQEPIISPKESHTEPKEIKKGNSTKDDKKLTDAFIKGALQGADEILNGYKYKNGKNASDNYALTFKIDADLEQYLKNIEIITFIDTMRTGEIQSTTKNEYVNDLIRADLKKRLGIKASETDPNKWIDAYKEYCKKYGVKDKNK